MSDPFIGQLLLTAFTNVPSGWASTIGSSLPINQNQALFSLLAYRFGGQQNVSFNLPDLRARLPLGSSPTSTPYFPSVAAIGNSGGNSAVLLTANQLPLHTHAASTNVSVQNTLAATTSVQPNSSGLTAATTINAIAAPTTRSAAPAGNFITQPQTVGSPGTGVLAFAPSTAGSTAALAGGSASTILNGSVTATAQTTLSGNVTATASTVVGANPTAGQAVTTMSPYLVLNYIIATIGLYPVPE